MKKLLTILTLLVAFVTQGWATETETLLYPTYKVLTDWSHSVQIDSKYMASDKLQENDVITVYIQDVGSGAQFVFQSAWSDIKSGDTQIESTKGSISTEATSFSLTLTSEIINAIKDKELEIKGLNYSIAKVTLTSGSTVTVLFGAMELDWSTGLQIEAADLPSMVVGDVLKAEFDITGDSPQGQFKYGNNWTGFSNNPTGLTSENKYIELTITEDIKSTLSTNKLVVSGQSCRLTKLSLIHTTYTLTIPSLTGGTIMIGNETAETKSYDKGTTLTLTATPNTGYDFNEWSSPSSLDETAKKNASLEITLNDDITAEATFVKKTFTLFVSSSNTDWGTASITTTPSAESYEYGTSVTVRAEPNNGYKFVNWTDTNNSDTEVSTNEEYTFEINTNTSLKANFASNQYTFSVTHDNGSVKVEKKDGDNYTETSETTFDAGTELKLTASPIADSEYYFSSWSSSPDNVLTTNYNVATLTLNQNTEVTATFSNVHNNSKEISVSNFEAMSPATFSDGTLKTSDTYQGIQEWIGDNSSVKGSILEVNTESNSRLKIVVGYTDGTETSQEEPGEGNETTSYSLNLSNKYIQKVMIQSAVTGDVKFTSIVLDPKFTLTVSQPTGGKIMIGDAVADATKDYVKGTSVTLTAVADGDYTFSNWVKDEQNAGNNTTLEVVMNAATSVSAVFTPVGNTTALTDGTTSCWGGATSYDSGTKKVTYKEQYAGFQSYYSSEKQKQASRLYLEFDVAVKLKVLVGYTDGYQSVFNAGESEVTSRSLKLESSKTIEKLQIYYDESLENDASKEVTFNQAYFDNETGTEDASSLKAPLDLSQFTATDNANYSNKKITASAANSGVKYSWNTAVLKGTRLSISTSDAALYDVVVSYSDETSATYKAGSTGAASRTLKLESNKLIKEIQILATAAGDITLSDAYVDMGDTSGAEEPTADFVLGENESELTPTSGTISTAVAWGENAANPGLTFGTISGKAGDIITVYGTSESSHQIQFQTSETDWGKIDKNADGTFSSGKFVYTLTGSTASLLRDANLFITGYGFTPEHVTLTTVGTDEYVAISEVALANFDNMDDKGSKQLYAGSNSTISAKDKKLVVTTSSDSKLKVAVYLVGVDSPITEEVKADGTAKTEYSVSLGSEDKKIKKIVITNNGDAEVTYSSVSLEDDVTTETAVFDSNGKADLSKFVAVDGATYDTGSHVISGSAWKDVKLTIPESEAVKGAELALTFDKAANVKVYYTCGENTYDLQTQSKEIRFSLESDKVLTCVNIQSAVDDQNITLKEVAVNSSATNLVDPTDATISSLATGLGTDGSIASEEVLSNIIAGDKIRITYDGGTSVSHELELQHKDSNWQGTAIPLDVVNSTAIEFTVSEGDMLTNIQAGRLYVSNHKNATISKVERITTAQETDPNEQDLSATINTGTDGNLTDAYAPYWKFLNAAAGDKINVYVSDVAASTSYSLKGHGENGTDEDSGWTKLDGTGDQNALETLASKIDYTLTENSVAYVKAHGLYLKSETGSFKVSKIAIISETAIPTSEPVALNEGDTEPNASTVDETIIVSEQTVCDDWTNVVIEASKFANANVGDAIKIYLSNTSAETGISLCNTADSQWAGIADGLKGIAVGAGATKYVHVITEATLAILKASGMAIQAKKCTIEKVSLLTAKSSTSTPIFDSEGKADLSKVEKYGTNVTYTYSEGVGTIASASQWEGVYLNLENESPLVSGAELEVTMQENSNFGVYVVYTDNTATDGSADVSGSTESGKTVTLELNKEKKIKQIQIKSHAAETTTLKLTNITLKQTSSTNTEKTLTTAVTPEGSGSVKVQTVVGETVTDTEDTSFASGTVLKLTAIANSGYAFSKWMSGDTELAANSDKTLTVTMDEDKTITAVFTQKENSSSGTITLDNLDNGWGSSYNASTKTITFDDAWQGRGWTIDSNIYNDKKSVLVKFNAVEYDVKLVIEYYNSSEEGATTTTVDKTASAGKTEVEVAIPEDVVKITKVYLSNSAAGTLTLTEATVTEISEATSTLFDSDGKADLSKLESQNTEKVTVSVSDGKATVVATEGWTGVQLTVADGETVSGKEIKITMSEAKALKVTVKKNSEDAGTDFNLDAAAVQYIEFDEATSIYQIQIQPTEAATLVIEEIKVNSESTKPADPVVTPVFTDGVADLSKFEVQDAEKVTYDTESHKITVTEGWTGVQATITEGEKVSGKELRITFAEASKVKVAVSYTDETKADDVIMSEAATICYVTLDNTKNVYQIQIQPTEAGSVTLKEVIVKAEATPQTTSLIDKFSADESDEAVTYTGHVMTTTEDNKYIQAWISGDNISGKRLVIATTGDNPPIMNILVQYNDDEKPIVYAGSTSTSGRVLKLDDTKTIQKIQIYLPTKGTVTFSEIYIDNEDNSYAEAAMFKLTTTAVNGQITVKKDGETGNTDNREFEYGTKLMLTATANDGYTFSKWLKDGEAAGTSTTLSLTMDADVTIEAVFKGSKLSNEERRTLWESATGETLTWSDMMVQPAEVGEIVEAGEILIITTSAVDTSEGHYPKIDLRDKDGNSLASIDPLVKGENKLSITSAMATKMAGGFKFQGESATLLRLELYKPTPITKLAEGDSKTLWQNADGTTLSWNTIAIDRAAEWGSVLEEDERIIISVKAKESGDDIWPTIQLQDLDGQKLASTATLLNDVTVPGDIVITLTAEMVEKLKNGFSITGDKATITSAILYKPALPAKTVKTLNDTETAITTDDLVTVSAAKLANISAYDVLTVNFDITAETAKLVIKCNGENGGWDYIKEMEFSDNETLFALPLTESAVTLLKANGLGITGSGYTFKSVTIKTAGEVADDETEEDDISNANASENTKKVYNVLKDLYGKKIVSGVVANIDWNTTEAENVYEWTGKYPAMNVFDYINLHASKDVNSEGWLDYSDITPAKNWWNEGGIVGAMWHWQMKANNGTDYTCTPGTAADETSFDASKVYVDGTSENTLAKQQLDQLCGYFAKMQEAGIPVVWRPLHEGSGNVEQYTGGTAWFWWGAKGADVYKKLWQWMYNYMVMTKGLNNLIWVWTSQTGDDNWYPGDAYVDIIGRDNYGATAAKLATEYEELKETYPNKMITLAECGNSDDAEMATISSIWDEGSRWSWFMTWYDNDYNEGKTTTHKHTSKTWWTNAVAKDYVVTRDQMKELLGQDDSGDSQTGVNISLDNLNEGWSSTYDATTKTITTTGEWAARGWYIGDDRYSQKGSITVKYEAVEFGVTLKMEYTNSNGESKSASAGAAAGETEVELDIPSDVKTIEKVYITYQPIGTLKLTAATVNDKVVDNRMEKTLVEKEAKIADGDIKINRGLFSNAVAKDVIRIYATGLSDASKIALEPGDYSGAIDGANWTSFTESPFELKLTESVLATIKEKGLLVRGESFTFTKAVLYTESDLGSEISDGGGDDSGDDSGDSGNSSDSSSSTTTTDETVFDQKDGEADLTKFAAQDEKTTTVTYDKQEGTLTITTTEDYKAAQIWFNTSEEVTGNVLEVGIAEAGVNVTITVGYTDGSESVMSSVVNAARAVAMTRGGSGTKIVVPLDEGKEIQKIEVKSAKAGTITINSMTMTTQNVFTNYKANLSMMKPQSGATYDVSTYTLATTKGWTGVTLTPLESETVKGAELLIRFQGEATVKVAVKYRTDEDGPSTIMEQADASVRLALNPQKEIQEITVQPTTASVLTFAEMAVYPEKGMGGLLSEGEPLEVWSGNESLSWNEIARQGKNIGAELQEYDEILVTVSAKAAGNDWPKVFLRDANYEMVGTEILLNEVETFPYVARFVLTKALVEKLKNGFAICGDGVTVTKVEVYRPYPPKKGDIHLRALDYGYGSEYDAATNTITTTQRWAARGWEIGDTRYNNKDLVLVQFEAVGFPVTLKMEYVDAYGQKQATSAGVAAGNKEVRLAIPSGIKQMDRAYIIYQNPGSLTLTNAEVITALQASSRGITEDSRGISISGGNSFRPDGSRSTDDDAWYTLGGQRIEKPTGKGVYIHNGKTVVVHE